jgi:predicted component of type VI protein secretion system
MHEFYLIPLWANGAGFEDPATAVAINQFPCLVGRSHSCHRRLHSPLVSRRHCLFSLREGRVWVEDLGSRNGTALNGKSVSGPLPLDEGDRLDLAGLPFLCLSPLPDEAGAEEVDPDLSLAGPTTAAGA